jgi:hypothetical protein
MTISRTDAQCRMKTYLRRIAAYPLFEKQVLWTSTLASIK